jgi:penicillin-insensitive murein DD-endopeptidase
VFHVKHSRPPLWLASFIPAVIAAALALAPLPAAAQGGSDPWARVMMPLPGPAQIFGGPTHGCIAGALPLPPDGPGYEVIRLSRHRNYGHPELIAYLERLGRRAKAAALPPFYVGDMAQPRGGPMPAGHAAHEIGMEADIWLTFGSRTYLPVTAREDVDLPSMLLANYHAIDPHRFGPKQMELIKLAATDPAVDRIFVNAVIKEALCRSVMGSTPAERAWLRRIRPWYGHDEHFHVRLHCPASSPHCEELKPMPEGDGCGAELESWLRHLPPPPPVEPVVRRMPILPAACHRVLEEAVSRQPSALSQNKESPLP